MVKTSEKWFKLAAYVLILGALPLQYFYYFPLRIFVCGFSFWVVSKIESKDNFYKIAFIGLGILFNPLFPFFFTKAIWIPIDLLGAYFFYNQRFILDSKPYEIENQNQSQES